MKQIAFILTTVLIFLGCADKTLKEQEIECKAEGKHFSAKEVLNHRTGEYEIRGFCK